MSEKSKAVERKILTELTERFIDALETKQELPWTKPWLVSKNHREKYSAGLGYVGSSGVEYGLLNSILLYLNNHEPGEFVTLNELMKRTNTSKKDGSVWGCFIRTADGEIPKSTTIVYTQTKYKKKDEKGNYIVDENGDYVMGKCYIIRPAYVWRIGTQVNCPCKVVGVEKKKKKPMFPINPSAEAEKIITEYFARESVKFSHSNEERAFYSPALDLVNVPPIENFPCTERYYSTCFHEIAHSTGHEDRLKRDIKNVFGNHAYSKEELVAEISACVLMHDLGINSEVSDRNSVAYVQGWAKSLKSDPTLLEWAFAKAEKAINYIYTGVANKK